MRLPNLAARLMGVRQPPADAPPRLSLLQRAIDRLGARRYLEIGVDDGVVFSYLTVPERIGVDPVDAKPAVAAACRRNGTRYVKMTSDRFFADVAPSLLAGGVDVAFVDGLHTCEQAYRDCLNALNYLTTGGVVLVHDCLPASEAEAVAAESYEAAAALNLPGWVGEWTGDVWKSIVLLRSQHADLDVAVFDCDHGIGLVQRGVNRSGLRLAPATVRSMTYTDFRLRAPELLGLLPGDALAERLDALAPLKRA